MKKVGDHCFRLGPHSAGWQSRQTKKHSDVGNKVLYVPKAEGESLGLDECLRACNNLTLI